MFDFYNWVLSFELVYNENLKVCQSTIVIVNVFFYITSPRLRSRSTVYTSYTLHTKTQTDRSEQTPHSKHCIS